VLVTVLAIIAAAAAVLGPALTYIIGVRRLSGRIGTSEAEQLWAESASIREYLNERIDFLEAKNRLLEERIALLEDKNRALHEENGALRQVIQSHEATINDQRRRIASLETEKELLEGRVKELEARHE
jgi:hypothetical protein